MLRKTESDKGSSKNRLAVVAMEEWGMYLFGGKAPEQQKCELSGWNVVEVESIKQSRDKGKMDLNGQEGMKNHIHLLGL